MHACPDARIAFHGGDSVKKAKFWIAAAILAGILIRPDAAVAGAQRAMLLWCTSVAPSLFPFLALMPALTGPEACAAYDSLLSGVMGKLFRLPGSAAPAVAIGMIAGSPGGALALCRVAQSSGLTQSQVRRIALSVSGVSPFYLILGVGYGLYGSVTMGIRLALIQLGIQLTLLCLLRGMLPEEDGALPAFASPIDRTSGVADAVERVLVICGYMVLFSSVGSVIASFAGPVTGLAALLLADLPSGLAELAAWSFPGKMLIQGVAIGFAGLCITAQNLDVLRTIGVRPGEYLAARGVAAGLFGCISGLVLRAQEINLTSAFEKSGSVYAISLAIACIFSVPGLIFLTKNLFLNKEN